LYFTGQGAFIRSVCDVKAFFTARLQRLLLAADLSD
jgi:hypothetical protein